MLDRKKLSLRPNLQKDSHESFTAAHMLPPVLIHVLPCWRIRNRKRSFSKPVRRNRTNQFSYNSDFFKKIKKYCYNKVNTKLFIFMTLFQSHAIDSCLIFGQSPLSLILNLRSLGVLETLPDLYLERRWRLCLEWLQEGLDEVLAITQMESMRCHWAKLGQ